MGTVLSISPATKKATIMDAEAPGSALKPDRSLKRHSMFVSLSWKKLVANSAKKSAKKVTPNPPAIAEAQLNTRNARKSEERKPKAPIPVPVPTVPASVAQGGRLSTVQREASSVSLLSPRRVVIQASTGELLRCLGDFMCRRCAQSLEVSSAEVVLWFRNIDRTLLIQGWQDIGFITPANVVFVYLLCRDTMAEGAAESLSDLQGSFLTCLYLAYSYMGNEISYPLKPFMTDANKDVFWESALRIIDRMSAAMLRLNADPHFFTEVFQDLKSQRDCGEAGLDR